MSDWLALRRLDARPPQRMTIDVDENGLVLSGRGGGAVRFTDIAEVAAEKVGKLTYDEVFLIVRDLSGNGLVLGELDEGFAKAAEALRTRLDRFPPDWWTAAEQAPAGLRVRVWTMQS